MDRFYIFSEQNKVKKRVLIAVVCIKIESLNKSHKDTHTDKYLKMRNTTAKIVRNRTVKFDAEKCGMMLKGNFYLNYMQRLLDSDAILIF